MTKSEPAAMTPDTVKVPREATREMIEAGNVARQGMFADNNTRATWEAMLAAAPPPQPEPGWQEERAAIVKWLDTNIEAALIYHGKGYYSDALNHMKASIERGDHRPAPPKETKP